MNTDALQGDSPRNKLLEVARLFAQAESEAKKAELLLGELSIPCVNELRYAGSHLIQGLVARDKDEEQLEREQLERACKHCRRALYDAWEAQILYYLEKISAFQHDYRNVVISDVLSNYTELSMSIQQSRDAILKAQAMPDKEERCLTIAGHVDVLAKIQQTLDASRDELNKKMRKERYIYWVGVLGVLGSILALVVSILK